MGFYSGKAYITLSIVSVSNAQTAEGTQLIHVGETLTGIQLQSDCLLSIRLHPHWTPVCISLQCLVATAGPSVSAFVAPGNSSC